jgi:hypothetical protein
MDTMYIALPSDDGIRQVQCHFDGEKAGQLASIHSGARIAARGRVDGMMMNVMVKGLRSRVAGRELTRQVMRALQLLALLCGSCAAEFAPAAGWGGGYSSAKVSKGRYVVTADCNWFNYFDDPVIFAYRRAQQLCEAAGFKTFDVESDRRPGNDAILVVTCVDERAKPTTGPTAPSRPATRTDDDARKPW